MKNDPKIIRLKAKKLVGLSTQTSLVNDKTIQLWKSFMPRRFEIHNNVDQNFYSIQIYPENFNMKDFTPQTIFEKWAAIEVIDFNQIPKNLRPLTLTGGLYAVFIHKGPAPTFPKTLDFIYNTWFPASQYVLDKRPHFEILDEDYHPNDRDAQEEVWIPIKEKN